MRSADWGGCSLVVFLGSSLMVSPVLSLVFSVEEAPVVSLEMDKYFDFWQNDLPNFFCKISLGASMFFFSYVQSHICLVKLSDLIECSCTFYQSEFPYVSSSDLSPSNSTFRNKMCVMKVCTSKHCLHEIWHCVYTCLRLPLSVKYMSSNISECAE